MAINTNITLKTIGIRKKIHEFLDMKFQMATLHDENKELKLVELSFALRCDWCYVIKIFIIHKFPDLSCALVNIFITNQNTNRYKAIWKIMFQNTEILVLVISRLQPFHIMN
jgi:hypothetical protein